MRCGWWVAFLLAFGSMTPAYAQDAEVDEQFIAWIKDFRREASQAGIPESVLEDAFADIAMPNESVIRLDRRQPEGTVTFTDYLASTIPDSRVEKGRALMEEHAALLNEIGAHYRVQPRFIVALWGMETSYGANTGSYSLVEALATLAYEGRRAEFFRKELMNTLRILASENIASTDLTGSWAGAMGHCQFMPSSYLSFAVDWDKDGKRDIWNSLPDIFASIANYLHQSGWSGDVGWGGAVTAPDNFGEHEARIDVARSLREWSARGFMLASGDPLPVQPYNAYAIYPGDPWEGLYLVSDNFKVLLRWNRSRYFATAVGTLADRIAEEG